MLQRVDQLLDHEFVMAAGDEVDNRLGIRSGLENRALPDQLPPQSPRIGQVAVMRERKTAAGKIGKHRLDIAPAWAAGGRIAHMADGICAAQIFRMAVLAENIANQAEVALGHELPAIETDDSGGFLTPMLQRMQAQRGQGAGIFVPEDPKHAAFLVQFVVGCCHGAGLSIHADLYSAASSAP